MYLIVGFDPGTSVGIGILNFRGDVVDLFSSKNMGINEVVEHIRKFGTAVLIASDVDHIPYTLYKVATALNAKIFIPENPISVSDKMFLTRNIKYHDAHQRDSLSAALYAYKRYRNLFEKIENLGYGDDVKAMVVKGKSIAEAIAETSSEPVETKKIISFIDISETDVEISKEKFNDIKEYLRVLEKANKILKTQINAKDAEIEILENKIKSLERDMKFKAAEIIKKEEKFERMAMEISLKSIREEIKKAEQTIKEQESFYERLGREECYLVGIYPEIFNGLTYIDKYITFNPSDTSKIEIAFTEKRINNCKTASPQKLKKISNTNTYYIEKATLEEIKASSDIESIIKEYKKSRRK